MSQLQGKVIITAALNGPHLHRGTCPTVPYSANEIALEAQRAANAGAAVVHFCPREPGGAISYRSEAAEEALAAIRAGCSAKASITTVDPRISPDIKLRRLDARPDRALIAVGCTTVAKFNHINRRFDYDAIDGSTFSDTTRLLERAQTLGVTPVLLCHDLGQVEAISSFRSMGLITESAEIQLRFGTIGGASALVRNLVHISTAVSPDYHWHVAVAEQSPWTFLAAALAAGGHLRVGLEDYRYSPRGTSVETSATLVDAAVNIVRSLGLEIAAPTDLN